MEQQQILYNFPSIAITAILFVLIIMCNEIGFRIGRYVQNRTDDEIKTLTGAIQASVLGLLALLLGFTFSMSMQRYDNRSQALISEANAIGTAVRFGSSTDKPTGPTPNGNYATGITSPGCPAIILSSSMSTTWM